MNKKTKTTRKPRKKSTIKKALEEGKEFEREMLNQESIGLRVNPKSVYAISNGFGCLSTMTGEELLAAFNLKAKVLKLEEELKTYKGYEDEIKSLHQKLSIANAGLPKEIPSIPKEEVPHWADDLRQKYFREGRHDSNETVWKLTAELKMIFPQKDLKGVIEKLTEGRKQFDKYISDAQNILDIQGSEGNWNVDEYQWGMFNGAELILAIFEGRKPNYRDKPEFIADQKIKQTMTDGVDKSPADIINEFLRACYNFPMMIPTILEDVNTMLLNRVKDEAERNGETAAISRERFEDCLQVIKRIAKG